MVFFVGSKAYNTDSHVCSELGSYLKKEIQVWQKKLLPLAFQIEQTTLAAPEKPFGVDVPNGWNEKPGCLMVNDGRL